MVFFYYLINTIGFTYPGGIIAIEKLIFEKGKKFHKPPSYSN